MLYLTADKFPVFVPFGIIGFYRYLWFIIRLLARAAYRPIPLPENPTYVASEDVTIIVPTIDAGEEFRGEFPTPEPQPFVMPAEK